MKNGSCCSNFSQVFLILFNLGFFAAAVLLIIASITINDSGWLDVFTGSYTWLRATTFWVMVGLAIAVIIISFMGCFGAMREKKSFLTCYNIFVIFAFLLFLIITIAGFALHVTAVDWKGKDYPGSSKEVTVAKNFDKVYCYSQAANVCTGTNVAESLESMFGVDISTIDPSIDLSKVPNITELCKQAKGSNDGLNTACEACEQVKKYGQNYSTVFKWANKQCPLNEETGLWCANFLSSGGEKVQGDPYKGAPYGTCRPVFLDLFSSYSLKLATAGIIISGVALVVILMVCSVHGHSKGSRSMA